MRNKTIIKKEKKGIENHRIVDKIYYYYYFKVITTSNFLYPNLDKKIRNALKNNETSPNKRKKKTTIIETKNKQKLKVKNYQTFFYIAEIFPPKTNGSLIF